MRFALFIVAALIGTVVGCSRQDEITRYSITVPEGFGDVASMIPRPQSVADGIASRMLAAIVPKGKQTWFFKLTGPDESVAKLEEPFTALVKSLRFTGNTGPPVWDLPEGWQQRAASGMRWATIEIADGDQTWQLTVIPLDTRGDLDEYVLANINRWRGELGLAPIAAINSDDDGDSPGDIRQFELSDATSVTLVNLVGRPGGSHTAAAGFNMADHPPIDGLQLGTAVDSTGDGDFTYATPEGWTALTVSGMRRAAFEVVDGERKLEITVIHLPQSGGERLANVNRWRNQIGLGDTTAEQLASDLQDIRLAETTGDYVELFGPEQATPREAILVALVDVAGKTWFFKLKGDAELAARERMRFQSLIRSAKFSSNQDGAAGE